jgi:hypothetical protein
VKKQRKLPVCATRADQHLDPGVAMDNRENLGNDKALKSPAGVNRRCRGGRSVVTFIFQRPLVQR